MMKGPADLRINASTRLLAVIGDPIEHSMSPIMHNAAIAELGLNYVYVAFRVVPSKLEDACRGFIALGIGGINVTIPHKVAIMKYLDEIDPIAEGIGAVNTVKNKNGILIGRNTDGEGALTAMREAGFDPSGKTAVIIGTGGAARAIAFTLGMTAKKVTIAHYKPKKAEKLAGELNNFFAEHPDLSGKTEFTGGDSDPETLDRLFGESDILINATPLGMYPEYADRSPVPEYLFRKHTHLFVFDCVYNPLETKLLRDAAANGCRTIDGLGMLVNQGAAAFEWWTGVKPDKKIMRRAALKGLGLEV